MKIVSNILASCSGYDRNVNLLHHHIICIATVDYWNYTSFCQYGSNYLINYLNVSHT